MCDHSIGILYCTAPIAFVRFEILSIIVPLLIYWNLRLHMTKCYQVIRMIEGIARQSTIYMAVPSIGGVYQYTGWSRNDLTVSNHY